MTLCVYKERMCVRELVSFWLSLDSDLVFD